MTQVKEMRIIHVSFNNCYRYGCATFQWHDYHGPTPINRHNNNPRHLYKGHARFWADVYRFVQLSEDAREQFRVY